MAAQNSLAVAIDKVAELLRLATVAATADDLSAAADELEHAADALHGIDWSTSDAG